MSATVEQIISSIEPGRAPRGIAAALLPFEAPGVIAEEAYCKQLQFVRECGLTNAVNMDTGYVNLLTRAQKRRVLELARQALGQDSTLIAGAFIEHDEGDAASAYRREIELIASFGATPILFPSRRLHALSAEEKSRALREATSEVPEAIGFELSNLFAPNGEIWDDTTFRYVMDIPQITGIKHSSLDRTVEFRRLEARNRYRPDFRIYTGNDLGINMIEYGSDYLLGLASFCPETFSLRDRLWAAGDSRYFAVSDAIQYLGNVAFRAPVPAYKHSAAVFLHAAGRIPTSLTHSQSAARPVWEADILADCANRLKEVGSY